MSATYENIQTETRGRVGIIRLNRPKALNALCADLVRELGQALDAFENDSNIGCMVLAGATVLVLMRRFWAPVTALSERFFGRQSDLDGGAR